MSKNQKRTDTRKIAETVAEEAIVGVAKAAVKFPQLAIRVLGNLILAAFAVGMASESGERTWWVLALAFLGGYLALPTLRAISDRLAKRL